MNQFSNKNYFTMPNEIFSLGLDASEIAVYAYLRCLENRSSYQCWPSYTTIGNAVGRAKNTVMRYVDALAEKGLIYTEPTSVLMKSGMQKPSSVQMTELGFLCHSSTDSSAASSVGAAQRINNIKVNKIRFVNNNRFRTTYGTVSLCGVDGNYVTKLLWATAGMGKNRSRNRMTKCLTVSGFPEVTVFAPFILQELSDIVQQCSCNSKVNIHLILFVRSIGSVERLSCLCTYLRYTMHMIGIGENEFRKIECKWELAQFLHLPVPLLQCSNVGVNYILL